MNENIPQTELQLRLGAVRRRLQQFAQDSNGILIFSRLNIYYFTGSFINGVLWVPLEGSPILLCKKGLNRAELEGCPYPLENFRGYSDIVPLLAKHGQTLSKTIAAEFNGLSWGLSKSLEKRLAGTSFVNGDCVISSTRAIKSAYEIALLEEAGRKQDLCMTRLLSERIHPGMTEFEIGTTCFNLFLENGSHAFLRMERFGEEVFFGHVAAGNIANYPSVYNGPVGLRGMHPSMPFMGSQQVTWQKNSPLNIDNCFSFSGYHTDKTHVYWSGSKSSIPNQLQEAHDFCLSIQEYIACNMRPGVIPAELYKHCLERAVKEGHDLGFMGLALNKVNFIGHGIGLVIDESPVIAKGFTAPFEKNMVLALEPKIGIEGIGMVGIENTFVVEENGGRSINGHEYEIICVD